MVGVGVVSNIGWDPRPDNRAADGGATALGCRVHFVDHLPASLRPDALLPVLDLVG